MENRRVEGSYVRVEDAMHAVQMLRDKGYASSDIYVVANATVRDSIPYTMDAEVSTEGELRDYDSDDDRSMWDKIKDAFTMDDYDTDTRNHPDYNPNTDPLNGYRDDIEQGNVIVLVATDANVTGTNRMVDTEPGYVAGVDRTVDTDSEYMSDVDDTIKLREERLDVEKNEVQTGEVTIEKRVVEETRNIEVPVTHEEVVIERRPVTDDSSTTTPLTDDDATEEIVIPLTEEQIEVTKSTHVVEEVDVRKDHVTENKKVTDTVAKEEIEVERDGDVVKENRRDTDALGSDRDPDYPL